MTTNDKNRIDFHTFLSRFFDNGERVWLKIGQYKYFYGFFNKSSFEIIYTKKKEKKLQKSRYDICKYPDAFERLTYECKYNNEGAFFLMTKNKKFPIGGEYTGESNFLSTEYDDIPCDKQIEKYQEFAEISGLKISALVGSGGKSIHAHWKISENIEWERRLFLMRLLTICLESDSALCSDTRSMRIPGFYRGEKSNYQNLEYLSPTDNSYDYERILAGMRQFLEYKRLPKIESLTRKQFTKWNTHLVSGDREKAIAALTAIDKKNNITPLHIKRNEKRREEMRQTHDKRGRKRKKDNFKYYPSEVFNELIRPNLSISEIFDIFPHNLSESADRWIGDPCYRPSVEGESFVISEYEGELLWRDWKMQISGNVFQYRYWFSIRKDVPLADKFDLKLSSSICWDVVEYYTARVNKKYPNKIDLETISRFDWESDFSLSNGDRFFVLEEGATMPPEIEAIPTLEVSLPFLDDSEIDEWY